jgi:transcriptional regulator of arginine metabolism
MNKYSQRSRHNAKAKRQQALLDIVRSEVVSTQSALVEKLRKRGVACTQVSVSRDIRDLGLSKKAGRYAVPSEPVAPDAAVIDVASNVSSFIQRITPVGDNLVVVSTLPGTAHSVGVLIDNLDWPAIAGTVAGDDTLFIAVLGGNTGITKTVSKLTSSVKKG